MVSRFHSLRLTVILSVVIEEKTTCWIRNYPLIQNDKRLQLEFLDPVGEKETAR